MFSKKYLLPVAFLSAVAIIGCGDDNSSSASTAEIPESVKALKDVSYLPCDASTKCTRVKIEQYTDVMECDGTKWQLVDANKPIAACTDPSYVVPASSSSEAAPAGEASSSSEGTSAGEASSSSEGAPTSNASSSSEGTPAGEASSSSEGAPAGEASSSSEGASAGEASSSSEGAAATSGDKVSCDVPGVVGECLEFDAGTTEAQQLTETCVSTLQGTLGTGCSK